jgi:hypothetical protein
MLGVVLELLVVEKQLLAGGEDKFGAAIATFQTSVDEFHWPASLGQGNNLKSATDKNTCRSRLPVIVPVSKQGPGPLKGKRQIDLLPEPSEDLNHSSMIAQTRS